MGEKRQFPENLCNYSTFKLAEHNFLLLKCGLLRVTFPQNVIWKGVGGEYIHSEKT